MEATTGPRDPPALASRTARRGSSSGWSMFQRSASIPSRRSSVNEVTLHTSAATPKSDSSSSAAASTSLRIVPDPSSCTRGPSRASVAQQVHPAQDPLVGALGHRRVVVVLVHQREVVEDVLLLGHHPPQPVLDDHRHLVAERGSYARKFGTTENSTWLWPSSCCSPSPFSVVRPAVPPSMKPRVRECRRPPTRGRPPAGSRTSSSRCRTGSSGRRARCRTCRRR